MSVRQFLTPRRAVAALAGLLFAVGACARSGPAQPPNVLLIVVDTLRADRLGVYGNPRGLSPFLDELARRGTVFANAYAATSWTCPSVASLFTSRYASQHHVNSFEASIAPGEITLAELLAERGYVGGGFSANLRMLEANGYAQGFRQWRAFSSSDSGGIKPPGSLLRRESLAWLQRASDGAATKPPMLLYLQYMEPHTPYEPDEPFRSTFVRGNVPVNEDAARTRLAALKPLSHAEVERLESLYDGEVATVDAEMRTLFGELEKSGFLSNAVIVITADHGEEFGEHGTFLHGLTLYNGVMRVPLILVAPGFAGGRVVDEPVSLVDVAPTLLELTGLPRAPTFEGRSLVPLMRHPLSPQALWARLANAVSTREVIGEIEPYGEQMDLRKHTQAIVRGSQKLLINPHGNTFLFDVQADPGEMAPLDGASVAAADRMLHALEQRRAELQTRGVAVAAGARPIDDATREQLRGLGYHP